jgi:Ca2+-transporting ATPase
MNWYETNKKDIIKSLGGNPKHGLTTEQVQEKQQKYGMNEFTKQKKESLVIRILHHLKDVSTIILILAALLSFILAIREGHGFLEPLVITAIIIMNLILAITQEGKAEKALESLASLNSPTCFTIRNGLQEEINTSELVPGDIILLNAGSMVPADARLLKSNGLTIDESALTGESEPSEKNANEILTGKVPVADQINMVFSGCLVTGGNATAIVTTTGMNTEVGHIADFLDHTKKLKTPLQHRLDTVGKTVSFIAIVSAVILFIIGMKQGSNFWSMILLAVTLAVAAVPETLSLIVTLTLSHGVKNMVSKNALIRKLPAVETLGNTSVICSDKTGTLTQNRMSIKRLYLEGEPPISDTENFSDNQLSFLKKLALASNATAQTDEDGNMQFIGNPTEVAIMRLFTEKGLVKEDLAIEYKKVAEIPFSSERKMMTVIIENPTGGYLVLSKGAIDRLPLNRSTPADAKHVKELHDSFAKDALRVIALGCKRIDEIPAEDKLTEVESDLTLVGIVGLIDPPRPEAAAAIATAKKAGIRTIMITGDHAATAGAIAKDIGILSEDQKVLTGTQLEEMSDEELLEHVEDFSVYARVSPADKIRIVEAWQSKGEVVAMTGDGVNDAPALKAADVGIAMGKSGTEVAKNASDMILTDDNFATIVEAVHQGRNVYSNIRKTIYFLLVCNLSEILVMLFAQLVGWGVLVTPVMLLLINVLGDGVPGLQLAKETSDSRIMLNAPVKRSDSLFTNGLLRTIIQQTLICSVVVLAAFYIGAFLPISSNIVPSALVGQILAFLVLGFTSILHIFTVRSRKSIFKRNFVDNMPLVISAFFMVLVLALLVVIPPIGHIFGLTSIGAAHWLAVLGLTIIPTIVAEIVKYIVNHVLPQTNTIVNYSSTQQL